MPHLSISDRYLHGAEYPHHFGHSRHCSVERGQSAAPSTQKLHATTAEADMSDTTTLTPATSLLLTPPYSPIITKAVEYANALDKALKELPDHKATKVVADKAIANANANAKDDAGKGIAKIDDNDEDEKEDADDEASEDDRLFEGAFSQDEPVIRDGCWNHTERSDPRLILNLSGGEFGCGWTFRVERQVIVAKMSDMKYYHHDQSRLWRKIFHFPTVCVGAGPLFLKMLADFPIDYRSHSTMELLGVEFMAKYFWLDEIALAVRKYLNRYTAKETIKGFLRASEDGDVIAISNVIRQWSDYDHAPHTMLKFVKSARTYHVMILRKTIGYKLQFLGIANLKVYKQSRTCLSGDFWLGVAEYFEMVLAQWSLFVLDVSFWDLEVDAIFDQHEEEMKRKVIEQPKGGEEPVYATKRHRRSMSA